MEDFGYKKNNEAPNGKFLTRKIFYLSGTLLSLSIFIFISLKAYKLINNNREIQTIKGPSEPIKVYEQNDYNEKNSDRIVNRSIYDDIFGNRKDMIQEEIKIKKNYEPAIPPKNIKSNNEEKASITNSEEESAENLEDANENSSPKNLEKPNNKIIEKSAEKSLGSKNLPIANQDKRPNDQANNSSILKRKRAIRVQISAMSSKENCEEYYKKLSRLYPNIFSRTKYYVETADLGKRGIFYRLQVGDFYNQVDAEEFCSGFISQTQKSRSECIIVE